MGTVFTLPPWVHLVVLSPFILCGVLLATRWLKATLVALQFRNRSEDYSADVPGDDRQENGKGDHG
jgi:uncharacterized protein (DUF983 family)